MLFAVDTAKAFVHRDPTENATIAAEFLDSDTKREVTRAAADLLTRPAVWCNMGYAGGSTMGIDAVGHRPSAPPAHCEVTL